MHPSTEIIEHCRAVRKFAHAASQSTGALRDAHIDNALHRLTLAVALYYSHRRFCAMVDDFQASLRGDNVIDIKARAMEQ